MNTLSTWMAATALIACAVVTSAQAQRPAGPGGPDGQPGRPNPAMAATLSSVLTPPAPQVLERLAEVVELTDTQAGKLEEIMKASNQKLQTLRQSAAKAVQALRDALVNPDIDTPKLKELAASAQKADTALSAAGLDIWIQVRSILNSEQLVALQRMSAPRPGGPGGPGGPQRPDGPPMEGQPFGPPPSH